MLFSTLPSYDHLRIFGCLAFTVNPQLDTDKFKPRGIPCVFLGYPSTQKGYKLLNLATKQTFVSRDVRFVENVSLFIPSHHFMCYILYLLICHILIHLNGHMILFLLILLHLLTLTLLMICLHHLLMLLLHHLKEDQSGPLSHPHGYWIMSLPLQVSMPYLIPILPPAHLCPYNLITILLLMLLPLF